MNNKERGKYLKKIRETKGLSQQELADKLNYTRQNLSRWENGVAFPSDSEIINKLADFLGVSNEDLINPPVKLKESESKKHKYPKFILAIFLIVTSIISAIIYLFKYQKIYNINFGDYFSGIYVINYKERHIYLYSSSEIEDYKSIYLYTVYNNQEFPIIKTNNKSLELYEKNFSNEYNLKYVTKCGLHLIIFFNDNTYKAYDYYINDKKYDNTCDYKFNYSQDGYLENYGFAYDGSNYSWILNGNKIIYDGLNYRVYINKNVTVETLETVDGSMYLYEKYNDKNEKLTEKMIKVNGFKNCHEENCQTYEDYAKFINFLIRKKE